MKKSVHYIFAVLLLMLTLFVSTGQSYAFPQRSTIPPGDEFIRFTDIILK